MLNNSYFYLKKNYLIVNIDRSQEKKNPWHLTYSKSNQKD